MGGPGSGPRPARKPKVQLGKLGDTVEELREACDHLYALVADGSLDPKRCDAQLKIIRTKASLIRQDSEKSELSEIKAHVERMEELERQAAARETRVRQGVTRQHDDA